MFSNLNDHFITNMFGHSLQRLSAVDFVTDVLFWSEVHFVTNDILLPIFFGDVASGGFQLLAIGNGLYYCVEIVFRDRHNWNPQSELKKGGL
jgi:hypothetical protein